MNWQSRLRELIKRSKMLGNFELIWTNNKCPRNNKERVLLREYFVIIARSLAFLALIYYFYELYHYFSIDVNRRASGRHCAYGAIMNLWFKYVNPKSDVNENSVEDRVALGKLGFLFITWVMVNFSCAEH